LIVGLSFKIAAVPFHMWVPDVYEGAPTTVTAFMSTAAKAAAFAAIIVAFGIIHDTRISTAFAVLAAASMIIGNVIAISQTSVKRMLAYSSIAHAGYILAGVAAGSLFGTEGVIFYVSVYSFMNIGAFGILSLIEGPEGKNLSFEESAGLAAKKPLLASLMAIFMFSLTGIPPFVGFFAKYYVFAAAVGAGMTWLAVVGVLTSLVSAYYYLRLVVVMYFREPGASSYDETPTFAFSAVVVAAAATIVFGFAPSLLLSVMHMFV
jgi:NADH-quinone oxidoreductase subunit N